MALYYFYIMMSANKDNSIPPPADQGRAIRNHIKSRLKHEERKLEKQRAETLEAGRYFWYGQIADSLMADPASAPRGTAKAEIINIHTDAIEAVALNPAFDAVENAELLYRKARRGKRGYDTAAAMMAETESNAAKLKEIIISIDELTREATTREPPEYTDEVVDRIREIAKGFLPPDVYNAGAAARRRHTAEAVIPFKKFVIDGWEIYMGKNSTQNDELSTRFAKPSDIWMHVVGYAGSHVIIRHKKETPPPPKEVLEKVAQITVWNSKAKHTSFAEVHVTEARFVRKRRRAPPGEVVAERCKTIRVEPKDPREIFGGQGDP